MTKAKKKEVKNQDPIEKIDKVKEGDILVCRLTEPLRGAQYANLVTRLNKEAKKTGVKTIVLPYEVELKETKTPKK